MEDKQFDAVKIVREIRDRQERQLARKSKEERLAYYRQQASEMQARVPELVSYLPAQANQPE